MKITLKEAFDIMSTDPDARFRCDDISGTYRVKDSRLELQDDQIPGWNRSAQSPHISRDLPEWERVDIGAVLNICSSEPPAGPKPKDTNPKTAFGATKPALYLVPSAAVLEMTMSLEDGANKYGTYNWRKDPVSLSTYISGAMRHLQCFLDGEDNTRDTNLSNLGAVMANCAIMIDAMACGTAIDDRPLPGKAGERQDALQAFKKAKAAKS